MVVPVVDQRYGTLDLLDSIDGHAFDGRTAAMIVYGDAVMSLAVAIVDFEA